MSWVDIQEKAFTRWVNEHLKDRGLRVDSLGKDLQDGLLLINLLEIISGKSVGRYNKHPIVPYQKYENNAIAMKFIADEGIKTVNISNEDITNGQLKLILGLIWTLILRYQINKGGDGDGKSELLKWVNSKIPEYNVKNFQKDWNDGKAICALVDALQPGLIPDHRGLNPGNALDNATRGINSAYENLGVPKVLLPEEMVNPKVDEKAVMTYISYLRDLPDNSARSDAGKCRAYGPGLVEGIVNEPAVFYVETPPHTKGKLEIKVEGPKSNAPVNLTKTGDGKWTVKYEPKEPGHYKVHVTLDGNHIPGSIFHVTVLENVSLGGEGKIRVFYSTTSAKDQKTRPLQELFENKGIHKRPDFEPWIPVDIMEPKDRDAVFKKAGTRVLPIIYIDDVYAGDYDRMFQLNKSGELDRLLKVRDEELAKKPAPVPYEQLKKVVSTAPKGAPSKGAYRSVPN